MAATTLTGISGVPQYEKNDVVYSANVKQMMAIEDVRMTITEVQANRNAGIDPRASLM